jgi:hypothetical protein
LRAAGYRFEARMRELETQFEAQAGELREAYLVDARAIQDGDRWRQPNELKRFARCARAGRLAP